MIASPDLSLFDPQTTINDGAHAEAQTPAPNTSGAREYGPNNEDLPEELQNALLALLQEAQRQDLYQRRIEVLKARRNRFYERGIQHIYEDMTTGIFVQGTPGALVPDPSGDGYLQCGQYIDNYNIFGRALRIIIAKLSENPVGVDFEPDCADKSEDLQACEAAESYRLLFDRRNSPSDLLTSVVRMMGTDGRTVTWTRTVADEAKWGTDDQGQPRQVQIATVYGVLETKVPIMATDISQCPYLIITEDPHQFIAQMEHPKFADKIRTQGDDAVADTQFERLARIGALQGDSASYQITDTYAWYVERKYAFLRPSMFMSKCLDTGYSDEEHAGEEWTLRDALNEAFPDGCAATFIGNQYVGSRDCCMDDETALDFPYPGDGMARDAIMDPAVSIQDDFNDEMNNFHEVEMVGWPSTWVNEDSQDLAAINDQIAAPYAFRALKNRAPRDAKYADQFFREPDPKIPETFIQFMEWKITYLLQFILAIPSAVQGAGMPDQKTAAGYNAALQQAMGQLGLIWGAVQRLAAKIYHQAALQAAKGGQDQKPIVIPGPKGAVTVSLGDLGKGHFLTHPDVDSGYPESTVQKRATLAQIMEMASKNPILAQQLFTSPDNWDAFARIMGIPEITLPEAKARRKQIAEIEILLQQPPQPPAPEMVEAAQVEHARGTLAAKAGLEPAPQPFDEAALMQSSIPPDELDFHDWEFEECREFLSDYPKVQQQITAGNQAGIENVRLHAKEHQKYMQMEQAAQAAAIAAQQPQQAKPQAKEKPQQGAEAPAA